MSGAAQRTTLPAAPSTPTNPGPSEPQGRLKHARNFESNKNPIEKERDSASSVFSELVKNRHHNNPDQRTPAQCCSSGYTNKVADSGDPASTACHAPHSEHGQGCQSDVKTGPYCCCCCCCICCPCCDIPCYPCALHRDKHSRGGWQQHHPKLPLGWISRLARWCRGGKSAWKKVLYVFYRLRQVGYKVCGKMGHHPQRRRHQRPPQPQHNGGRKVLVIGMEAREQAATLHQRRELQFSFPTQVQRSSDGEGHSVRRFPLGPEHDEQRREFIKPPANRTATDVGNEAPYRHSSFQNLYTTPGEGGVGQCGPYTYHHQYPPSSSSASLSSQPGYGDEGRGSPRRSRKMAVNLVRPIVPCQTPFSPNKYQQDSSQRLEWSHGLSMSTPSPPHDSSSTLTYSSATNALADINTLPAGCGPTPLSSSERHAGVPGDSQAMGVGGMGAQTSLPHRYEQFSESPCSPTADSDHPPLYSEVIDNSNLYTSVSRPSEQRTKSGKI